MTTIRITDLPALGQPFFDGISTGIFAGLITRPDGTHGALVLLTDKPASRLPWAAAMEWAKSLEAELPSRPEAAMLFAHLKDEFEAAWHWTRDEFDGSFAWYQGFVNGSQNDYHKSYEGRARAVRFIPLESA